MAKLAFLGTGLLGGAFAEAAAKRGDTVVAWNRSPDKARALAPFGIAAAATPAEAVVGASRVHLILKDDAVVEEVIAAARPGLSADAVLIDHSTTLPALTAERAGRLAASVAARRLLDLAGLGPRGVLQLRTTARPAHRAARRWPHRPCAVAGRRPAAARRGGAGGAPGQPPGR